MLHEREPTGARPGIGGTLARPFIDPETRRLSGL
jgi:hypothetical protein